MKEREKDADSSNESVIWESSRHDSSRMRHENAIATDGIIPSFLALAVTLSLHALPSATFLKNVKTKTKNLPPTLTFSAAAVGDHRTGSTGIAGFIDVKTIHWHRIPGNNLMQRMKWLRVAGLYLVLLPFLNCDLVEDFSSSLFEMVPHNVTDSTRRLEASADRVVFCTSDKCVPSLCNAVC